MGAQLTKPGIDLGVVVSDGAAALRFYCDLLGLEHVADIPMPLGGGGTMHRVQCGDSLLKLISFDETPPPGAGGGIPGALGLRYLTIFVSNLEEMVAECSAADVPVLIPVTDIRPGLRMAIVADPDGNSVEFVEAT